MDIIDDVAAAHVPKAGPRRSAGPLACPSRSAGTLAYPSRSARPRKWVCPRE